MKSDLLIACAVLGLAACAIVIPPAGRAVIYAWETLTATPQRRAR